MQSYARICIVVNINNGLSTIINIHPNKWTDYQEVDDDQLPFKCKNCHGDGNFS